MAWQWLTLLVPLDTQRSAVVRMASSAKLSAYYLVAFEQELNCRLQARTSSFRLTFWDGASNG